MLETLLSSPATPQSHIGAVLPLECWFASLWAGRLKLWRCPVNRRSKRVPISPFVAFVSLGRRERPLVSSCWRTVFNSHALLANVPHSNRWYFELLGARDELFPPSSLNKSCSRNPRFNLPQLFIPYIFSSRDGLLKRQGQSGQSDVPEYDFRCWSWPKFEVANFRRGS